MVLNWIGVSLIDMGYKIYTYILREMFLIIREDSKQKVIWIPVRERNVAVLYIWKIQIYKIGKIIEKCDCPRKYI